jgi:allophanate hydrolase subunit 1
MKKNIIIGIIVASLIATITALLARVSNLANERNIYQSNTYMLLDSIRVYKVNDSLSAASARQLQLTLDEYKQSRAADYALIKQLQADKKRLEQVTTVQTETAYEVSAPAMERVVALDSIIRDTVRCYVYEDVWLSFDGCVSGAVFTGKVKSRDSLIYVEHIVPKRFLGFLWKYGVRERRQEIISKNPHTEIVGAEFVTIRE